jgi:hypothetical protein
MVGLVVVAVWFTCVAVYLVRQWWVSELALAYDGVDAQATVTLPAAPQVAEPVGYPVGLRAASAAAR